MTCAFVKPAAGYRTLSRFETATVCPSMTSSPVLREPTSGTLCRPAIVCAGLVGRQDGSGLFDWRLNAYFVDHTGYAFDLFGQGFGSFADEPVVRRAKQERFAIHYLHVDAGRVHHLVLFQAGLNFAAEAL